MEAKRGEVDIGRLNGENQDMETFEKKDALDFIIETVKDSHIPALVKNKELFKQFCEKLIAAFENLEKKEIAFERFLSVIKELSLRSEYLQQLIRTWLPKRQTLLDTIQLDLETMDFITKTCNTGRLISSTIDTIGLVSGFAIGNSNSQYAMAAFNISSIFRVLGFGASAAELYNWKSKLERLMKLIQEDHATFSPIEDFFQQHPDLEEAVKAIFPFEITNRIVKEFGKTAHTDLNKAEMLQIVLGPLLMENTQRLRDVTLIRNLVAFSTCPAARDMCRWAILRHHKLSLDIDTMLLQLINPQRFITSQSISVLPQSREDPLPIALLARIGLNCLTAYDAVYALRNPGLVEELLQLQKHLEREKVAVLQMSKLLKIRIPS